MKLMLVFRSWWSDRERRLWTLATAVVVAIYSTLGLARQLAGELRDRELLDATFFVGMLVILGAIAVLGLRSKPGIAEVAVAVGVAAVYVMVLVRMTIPEERTHLIEYSMLALLVHEALKERLRAGRPVRRPALLAAVAISVVGVVDELIQLAIPSRVFDPVDILFNILASIMAVGGSVALSRVRRAES